MPDNGNVKPGGAEGESGGLGLKLDGRQILQAGLGMCHVLWSTNMPFSSETIIPFSMGNTIYVSSFNHGPFSIANWPFICPVRLRRKKSKLNGTSFCKPNLPQTNSDFVPEKMVKTGNGPASFRAKGLF